ncbi:MAG TPA: flavin reductase family protein [Nevskiaceae bacterium]|nr:flavin reductase family protein [Nevskiaceae bacterium]
MTVFDKRALRTALGSFATGVTIVTARNADGDLVGVTANSFSSVSLDPPMVLWSLDNGAYSRPVFEAAGAFVVNILAADQIELSNRFARKGGFDKFEGVAFRSGVGGAPVLEGVAASFECRTAAIHDGGDHRIFLGHVQSFADHGLAPLLFHRGVYARAA